MAFSFDLQAVDFVVIATLILLEGVLSFDNAAILAAMVRRLPEQDRRKALLYGLVGAYVFRIAAVAAAVYIIHNPWMQIVGAAYLIFLPIKHFHSVHKHGASHHVPAFKIPGLSVFWSMVVMVELTDIAFALDQITAAVGFTAHMPATKQIVVVMLAAIVAILLLRLCAFYMTRMMAWFPALEHIAYVVVGLVGLKIVVEYWVLKDHLPEYVVAPVTLGLFVVPITVKVVMERVRRPQAAIDA